MSEFASVAVDLIIPSPRNKRAVNTSGPEWTEFLASVKRDGVIVPLIARRMPVDGAGHPLSDLARTAERFMVSPETLLDLISGHRRLEAAKAAGIQSVTVNIREMDDQAAMALMMSENKERADLTPLEFAEQICAAREIGMDDATIADKLGKSAAWVARRAKLLNLSPAWRRAAADPTNWVSTWPVGALEAIARLELRVQDSIDLNELGIAIGARESEPVTASAVEKWIATTLLRSLHRAKWKLDDQTLHPKAGPCVTCPKRASQELVLFEEIREAAGGDIMRDRCLDHTCWTAKLDRYTARKINELEGDHKRVLPVIPPNHVGDTAALAKKFPGAVPETHYDRVKSGTPGAVPGVIVAHGQQGEVVWLAQRAKLRKEAARPERSKPTALTPAQREKALQTRRLAWAIRTFQAWLVDPEGGVKAFAAEGGMLMSPLVGAFGTIDNARSREPATWNEFRRLQRVTGEEGLREAAARVMPVLKARLNHLSADDAPEAWEEACRIGRQVKHDMRAILKRAEEEITDGRAPAKPTRHARRKAKAKAGK